MAKYMSQHANYPFMNSKIRNDFPLLSQDDAPVYLDNACMTLKPRQVVEALQDYYYNFPACAGRSHHKLGHMATEKVQASRKTIRKFIGARKDSEIIFTKNATEAINLALNSLDLSGNIVTSDKEHNSNLLPVQFSGVEHRVARSAEDNSFDLDAFSELIDKDTSLVSVCHTSNLDGTSVPDEIVKLAHDNDALVLLDAAQSVPHRKVDVKKLGVDLLAFSGHKMLGPTGTGALYAREDIHEMMRPFIVGGETVTDSTYDSSTLEKPPHRFEAGLQHYAGIIGFAAAAKYLDNIGMDRIHKHEQKLNRILTERALDKVLLIGPSDASKRSGIFSFNVKGVDPHTVAMVMDSSKKVMIRSGAHCVHSWFNAHKLQGSARASMYLYNTEEEIDIFLEALDEVLGL